MLDMDKFKGHTPGPLTVDNTQKHAIYVRDASGEAVLHSYRHAFSSSDKTPDDAINCVNFFRSRDESIADYNLRVSSSRAANLQQIADFHLYAAAPELLAEVVRLREVMNRLSMTALMLLQNAEGCAANHYGSDYQEHGEPGWLADCRADVLSARKEFGAFP